METLDVRAETTGRTLPQLASAAPAAAVTNMSRRVIIFSIVRQKRRECGVIRKDFPKQSRAALRFAVVLQSISPGERNLPGQVCQMGMVP